MNKTLTALLLVSILLCAEFTRKTNTQVASGRQATSGIENLQEKQHGKC
jgi:hypothetical protein